MFLQFFIWGAWYTTIAVYMTSQGMETLTHWPFTVNPIAAIVAPFFVGLVADRYFATQKVLGVLHLVGGLVLLDVPGKVVGAALEASSFHPGRRAVDHLRILTSAAGLPQRRIADALAQAPPATAA